MAVTRVALGSWIFIALIVFGGKWFSGPRMRC